jgi:CheY-like chemotaxis protein
MNGFEICRRIRAYESYRPTILAISGHPGKEVEERSLEAGADAFFSKPLDMEELLRVAIGPVAETNA